MTPENQTLLLDAAVGKTRREVARQVAALRCGAEDNPRPAMIRPIAADRYQITFEMRDSTYEKLQRAKDPLAHAVPDGNVAEIFDRALTSLLRRLGGSKFAETDHPRQAVAFSVRSRHIPATVRRAVARRDQRRCAFIGPHGRCSETSRLEFHHVIPFAAGGESTVDNIQLRCRAHNQREAELYFGADMPLFIRERNVTYGELGPDPLDSLRSLGARPTRFAPLARGRRLNSRVWRMGCCPVIIDRSGARPEPRSSHLPRPHRPEA